MRSRALELEGEVDVTPPPLCSSAERIDLSLFHFMWLVPYNEENPRVLWQRVWSLFPSVQSYQNVHHVLLIVSRTGWLRIYLFFVSEEEAYAQVQNEWFRFDSWQSLYQWLAFLLAIFEEGTVYSYPNVSPSRGDHFGDPPPPPPTKRRGFAIKEFIDR